MTRADDFWSRRKARVAQEDEAEARARQAREAAERDARLAEKPDEEILAELDLPDPDTLEPGDDFKAFMAKAVPERIRRRALRRLWLSNPALANLDGLIDYGEDFTDSATVVENLQTAYQVGKGMMAHVEELARKAAEAETAASEGSDDAAQPETPAPEDDTAMALAAAAPQDQAAPEATPQPDWQASPAIHEEPDAPAPRRRMRFEFDEQDGVRT